MIMGNVITVDWLIVPVGKHANRKILIGSDHRGYRHKKAVFQRLASDLYDIEDVGTYSPDRCDYPLISANLGRRISEDAGFDTVGIGICGSGNGILFPACKYSRVIGARCLDPGEAANSRTHNNTNYITIGADKTSPEMAFEIVDAWLNTPFYASTDDYPYLRRYLQVIKDEERIFTQYLPVFPMLPEPVEDGKKVIAIGGF